ncbi:hypothetical protein K435DRAFT_110196 [Dendrothele bispora CBS 962.96]|uniref:Glycopeptide n=1 Tax=Dendrothele bispora (strain CBS 962.96) TaxID=1314807 RepID=A0A4S8M2R6_DENBC|nr:hypothetical protein K435DRAFT_110196 [Dendrothele bispora CBS 962.96]
MAVIGGNTESHIVNLINQCGFGEPVLLQNGNPIQLSGNKLTSNGAFTAGVAYLDTGNCGTLSNDCIVVEMSLQNSGVSAADISLISPHEFNVPVRFEFANGNCTGQGQTCSNESCNNALHDPTDVQGTVICQEENVGLDITFCPGNSTTTTR